MLVVVRIHERLKSFRATKGVLDGLVLAIVGSSGAVLYSLFVSNGVNIVTVVIAVIAAALALDGRVPSWLLLAVAGIVGALLLV